MSEWRTTLLPTAELRVAGLVWRENGAAYTQPNTDRILADAVCAANRKADRKIVKRLIAALRSALSC